MRVFVAGGSGVIGTRLLPLLVAAGHEVVAMTRTPGKVDALRALGAEAVVADAYEAERVVAAVLAARPDAVVHQLTDLPDDPRQLATARGSNARIREEGTDHLLAAAGAAGAGRIVVQSIAWLIEGQRPPSVAHLERRSRAARGVVLRYGQWYGPGTYHPYEPPAPPRVHVDRAARLTLDALALEPGTYTVTDDGIAPAGEVATTIAFNAAINDRDLAALTALMTPDHRFVDASGATLVGRDACHDAWGGFFERYPDYRNVFDEVVDLGAGTVRARGRSACSEPALDGPAEWCAEVLDGLVAVWQVSDPHVASPAPDRAGARVRRAGP